MEKESFKAKETAKKKETRKANPYEGYSRKLQESGVESDEALASKTSRSANEALAHGYTNLNADMDMFDNERNVDRMANKPKDGPKKKVLDPEGEDYGHEQSTHLDD